MLSLLQTNIFNKQIIPHSKLFYNFLLKKFLEFLKFIDEIVKMILKSNKHNTWLQLLPINSNAASMTAAPFNMVAIRMSWPGQSTKETCL